MVDIGVENTARMNGIMWRKAKEYRNMPMPAVLSKQYIPARSAMNKVIPGAGTRCQLFASMKIENIQGLLQKPLIVRSTKEVMIAFGRGPLKKFETNILHDPRTDNERRAHYVWKTMKPIARYAVHGFAEMGPIGLAVGFGLGVGEASANAIKKKTSDNKYWIRAVHSDNERDFSGRDVICFWVVPPNENIDCSPFWGAIQNYL